MGLFDGINLPNLGDTSDSLNPLDDIKTALDDIVEGITSIPDTIKDTVIDLITGIKSAISGIGASIKKAIGGFLSSIGNSIRAGIRGIITALRTAFKGLGDTLKGVINKSITYIAQIPKAISSLAGSLVSTIKNLVNDLTNTLGLLYHLLASVLIITPEGVVEFNNIMLKAMDLMKGGL